MSVSVQVGQWYRVRNGSIVYVASVAEKHDAYLLESATTPYYVKGNGKHLHNNDAWDIVEHLPDCTGFDWVPPKPVVAPDGWRLLTHGEKIERDDLWWDTREWRSLIGSRSAVGESWDVNSHCPVCRKIDPPQPKYRPFKWEERDQLLGRYVTFTHAQAEYAVLLHTFHLYDDGKWRVNGWTPDWILENTKFLDGNNVGVIDDQ